MNEMQFDGRENAHRMTSRYSNLGEDRLQEAVERLLAPKVPEVTFQQPPGTITRRSSHRRVRPKLPVINGARERTRTSTPLRELAPEASASANSATRALLVCGKTKLRGSTILTRAPWFVNAAHHDQELLTHLHVRTTLNRWARGEQETKTWLPPAR
jgi:hypothetical protein